MVGDPGIEFSTVCKKLFYIMILNNYGSKFLACRAYCIDKTSRCIEVSASLACFGPRVRPCRANSGSKIGRRPVIRYASIYLVLVSRVFAANLPKSLAACGLAPVTRRRSTWVDLSAFLLIVSTPSACNLSQTHHGIGPGR
jgi:hypothetical protein